MKNIFSLSKWVLGFALLSWIIPFFLSAFFVNMETGELLISPLLFHGGLFVLFALIVWFFYKKLHSKNLFSLQTAHTFVAINIVLDIGILYGLMKAVTLSDWIIMIAPVYIIACYGLYYLMKK